MAKDKRDIKEWLREVLSSINDLLNPPKPVPVPVRNRNRRR